MVDVSPSKAFGDPRRYQLSVAFRREGDDEHKEPQFDIPLPPGPNLVTARGFAALEARLAELEAAHAGGDESVARDLKYYRTRVSTAEITAPVPGQVSFGSRVRFKLAGKTRTVDLVGSDEADPAADRIAFTAPLAQAMMELEPGDFAEFNGREDAIEVLGVEAIPE